MAIPDYQTIMAPLLRLLSDGKDRHVQVCTRMLADQYDLSAEERKDILPSGRQDRFTNRVHWAASYLSQAGMVERPARGQLRITERGRDTVRTGPERITAKWLKQFTGEDNAPEPDPGPVATPEEELANSYQRLRMILADELLERIKRSSPPFFEQLVVDLLVAMGYGGSLADAGQAVGRSGDGGIDGIIKEDRLGLDFIYVQAKRWENPVGRPIVQGFAGGLQGHSAQKGVFMTTSNFTKDARDYVRRLGTRIVLIDGQELTQLMIDHGVGVSMVVTYEVKRVDADYFDG